MTYEYYIEQAGSALELRLNLLIARNPQLNIAFGPHFKYLLNRKYSHIAFN